jgi:small-conductance mechanosensitive channel
LTSLGIVAIAIAFASQQIMQNAIAGILISLDKRIQTDDWVEVGGAPNTNIAFVKDIRTLGTIFIDTDGREFVVPNSFLLSNKLVNYSKAGVVMVSMGFIIPLDNDIPRIRDLVIEEARNYGKILPWSLETDAGKMQKASSIRDLIYYAETNKLGSDPFKPVVLIRQISDKGYDLEIRLWSLDIPLRDHIKGDLIELILLRMRRDGFNRSTILVWIT